MAKLHASAERSIGAPASDVYRYIADFREHHFKWVPSEFSDVAVERGGYGAGTFNNFTLTLGGRPRRFHTRVDEPIPGQVLTESDDAARSVTTFTVTPNGETCRVRIESDWESASGVAGLVERLIAPRLLQGMYIDQLERLDRYARERSSL
jgi:hypothetical protein